MKYSLFFVFAAILTVFVLKARQMPEDDFYYELSGIEALNIVGGCDIGGGTLPAGCHYPEWWGCTNYECEPGDNCPYFNELYTCVDRNTRAAESGYYEHYACILTFCLYVNTNNCILCSTGESTNLQNDCFFP